jgi:hypothetical protein
MPRPRRRIDRRLQRIGLIEIGIGDETGILRQRFSGDERAEKCPHRAPDHHFAPRDFHHLLRFHQPSRQYTLQHQQFRPIG